MDPKFGERRKTEVPQVPEDSTTGLTYDFMNETMLGCFADPENATIEDFVADVKSERDGRLAHYEDRYPLDYYDNVVTEKNRPFVEEVNSLIDKLNAIVQNPQGHTFQEVREIDSRMRKVVRGK